MSLEGNITNVDYKGWLEEIKSRIQSARGSAARAMNRELIQLYWDIGCEIVEKQAMYGWGASVVDQLSKDLQREFPSIKGFSPRNLRDMKRFFGVYSNVANWRQAVANLKDSEILESLKQLVFQIPWGHNLLILSHLSEAEERLYYLRATEKLGWTRKVLLNQIKADAYSRSLPDAKSHNFSLALPEYMADQVEETLKSSYSLEFLGIRREIKERELEDRLVDALKDFMLELGYGFCFIGRQYRVSLGEKDYFIDLLFYHRFLKCLVAIELKIGEFEPEYAGKMDFYLNLLNENERADDDNPAIGIILCAEKDDLEVEFALKSKKNPIGVAEYQLKHSLPKELKGKLPSSQQLADALQRGK
jgi:predicted nuclease of restriction endonuclease-like (RecB) superfamily